MRLTKKININVDVKDVIYTADRKEIKEFAEIAIRNLEIDEIFAIMKKAFNTDEVFDKAEELAEYLRRQGYKSEED